MRRLRGIALWLSACVVLSAANAEDAALLHDVDAILGAHEVPGAALVLLEDGKVTIQQGFGLRRQALAAPVNANTLFRLGSISKSFTDLAVALLIA